jgi:hypothetical protein
MCGARGVLVCEAKVSELVVAKGGVEIVLELLRTHISQEGVVVNACKALAILAAYGMFCVSSFSFVHPLCSFRVGLHDIQHAACKMAFGALCFVPIS